MSCGIGSPKQLFRVQGKRKGPMLPHGLQTLGGGALEKSVAINVASDNDNVGSLYEEFLNQMG